jgi:hypothetical protein
MQGAISLKTDSLEINRKIDMQHKPASTGVKIHDIIQQRWSPRAFDANE